MCCIFCKKNQVRTHLWIENQTFMQKRCSLICSCGYTIKVIAVVKMVNQISHNRQSDTV